jgi:FtsH-binding integral membrane protein
MELLSIPAAFMLAVCVSQLIDDLVSFTLLLPAFAMVFSLIMLDLGKRTLGYKKHILVYASLVTSLCFIFQLSIYGGLINGIACALIGLTMLTLGYVYKVKTVLMTGAITAVVAVIYDVVELYATIDLFNWTSLAIIGVTAIIIGSVIDRHGVVIKLRVDNLVKNIETRMV